MEASALPAPAAVARSRLSVGAPLLRLRSDEQLVAMFRAGDDEAFRVIHDRYRQRLFAYTRQMLPGSRQDAEDAPWSRGRMREPAGALLGIGIEIGVGQHRGLGHAGGAARILQQRDRAVRIDGLGGDCPIRAIDPR